MYCNVYACVYEYVNLFNCLVTIQLFMSSIEQIYVFMYRCVGM